MNGRLTVQRGKLQPKQKSDWERPGEITAMAAREDQPKDKSGCLGGCKEYAGRGSNAYVDVKMRKKSGKQEKAKKELMEMYEPENCPREVTDSIGSSKTMSRSTAYSASKSAKRFPKRRKLAQTR